MIVVNLLPQDLRPIKRTPLPHILSLLVLVLAVAGMGALFLLKIGQISSVNQELASTVRSLDELQHIVDEYNALTEKQEQLENKIGVIQEILSDRIIWSEQLHELATLTPENFWYKRIRVTSKTVREERVITDPETGAPVVDPKTKKVKTIKENVKRPVLELSGYIISNEEGSNQMNPLTFATEEDKEFSATFVLERPQLLVTEYNGIPVNGFVLEYGIEPGGES